MGDRMKMYEMELVGRKFMPLLPVVARLDGKCFSKFTEGLKRPFDKRLSDLMVDTAKHLVKESGAVCGYTQSDEITLAWCSSSVKSQIYFDGRIQKMISVLAATASVFFNKELPTRIPEKVGRMPVFDCRAWQMPNLYEATNAFLWREFDATKNSIAMAASHYYEHEELMGKHSGEKQEMLFRKGVNWNDYPDFFKRGSFVQPVTKTEKFSKAELASLPPKHHAHTNPDLEFERTEVQVIPMPPFGKVVNRTSVIFRGEVPVINERICHE